MNACTARYERTAFFAHQADDLGTGVELRTITALKECASETGLIVIVVTVAGHSDIDSGESACHLIELRDGRFG